MTSPQKDQAEKVEKRSRLRRGVAWLKSRIEALRPGPRFWKGASIGAVFAALLLIAYLAASMPTGLSPALNVLIALLASAIALGLSILITLLVIILIRAVPRFILATVLGVIIASLAIL
ncbi:MAG TPA: hypothetical protein VFQ92_25275, partial [Blastocatellia bacterium]|nr:hypothetical protein [Blastocatellia bacterium]